MSQPSSKAGAGSWLRGLWPGRFGRTNGKTPIDPLRSTGQWIREAREAKGLGLRDLAQRTRISIAVLEALEGGWKDRLPEATYLRAMLPLLEQHLDLPTGSLEPVLAQAGGQPSRLGQRGEPTVSPFSPSTLHLLSSWQSAIVYGLGVLGLIYGVNLQQQRLAAMGHLVSRPIPMASGPIGEHSEQLDSFPDLQPLKLAAKGQALDLLAKDNQRSGPDLSLGLLRLSLNQPTQLDLRSRRGGNFQLQGLEGNLSLPVLPPFELRLSPAPPPESVRWKERPLQEKVLPASEQTMANKGTTGVYVVPVVPPPAASRPAKTP
jgi:transcriptional regulator with XRE-family HTH domain